MNVTRRGFIKGMGAVAGASGVSFSLPTIVRAAEKAEASAVAKSALGDQVVKSTCVHCVNFCGIEARVPGQLSLPAQGGVPPGGQRRKTEGRGAGQVHRLPFRRQRGHRLLQPEVSGLTPPGRAG